MPAKKEENKKTTKTVKPIIELRGVCKTYYTGGTKGVAVRAICGVNLSIARGEFVAIMGPSGSGKSTLMNCVGALDLPTEGAIYLDGEDIAKMSESDLATVRGRKIGFVFQNFNLIQSLSAYENAELPLLFQDVEAGERRSRLERLFTRVGLAGRWNHMPMELSGGEQQRVAVVRALAVDPEVILADLQIPISAPPSSKTISPAASVSRRGIVRFNSLRRSPAGLAATLLLVGAKKTPNTLCGEPN